MPSSVGRQQSMCWNWKPKQTISNNIFRAFTSGSRKNELSFQIRLLREDSEHDHDIQYTELVLNVLLEGDPMIRALGFSTDPVSINSLRNWIGEYLRQNIVLGCFLQRDDQIEVLVAVDVLYVKSYRDVYPQFEEEGDAFKNFMKYIKFVDRRLRYPSIKEAKKMYISYDFLTSFGIYILPEYREADIEEEMIKMRTRIAKNLRIRLVGSAFISEKMQNAAKKYGYEVIKIINEQDMLDCDLRLCPEEFFEIKIMKKKIISVRADRRKTRVRVSKPRKNPMRRSTLEVRQKHLEWRSQI